MEELQSIKNLPRKDVTALVIGGVTCGACQVLKGNIAKTDMMNVFYIDVQNCGSWASHHQVRSLPTTFIMKNGKVVGNIIGNVPPSKIKEAMDAVS